MHRSSLRLGTRRSLLARAQSGAFAARLREVHPSLDVDMIGIETRGDRVIDVPLASVEGKEFFTAELDQALLDGRIDFAVHSFKDLSLERPPGLTLAAVPARANPRDVILFGPEVRARLEAGAALRIGSSAPRRQQNVPGFLARALPVRGVRLDWHEIRGNVDSRVRRLFEPPSSERHLDAVVLAFAGLIRLWADEAARSALRELLERVRWMVLPLDHAPAAPAQGALAVECRTGDEDTLRWLRPLHDERSAAAVEAERQLLGAWGGGCHQRFGVTQIEAGVLGSLLFARGVRPDGAEIDEFRWSAGVLPPPPAGPVRAWNGSKTSRAIAIPIVGASAPPERGSPLFIANDRALPDAWCEDVAGSRVWVPGSATWFRLAERGIWVEGCAESLGFDALRPTVAEPVLGLAPLAEWSVLTHAGALDDWNPARAIATYRLEAASGDESLSNATHLYWSSGSQYALCREHVAPGAHHACGPGKTALQLQRLGVKPLTVFPSVREWQAWVGGVS
jgi:hydroxymethylbilane synthase